MPYNFDELTERRGTGSMKWDVPEGELPMWVADMDFETAPEIREALMKRAAHGIFGYTVVPDAWREAASTRSKFSSRSSHRLVGTAARLCDGKRLAGIYHRSGSGYFKRRQKADDGWRKCAGSDTGLQHLF